MKDIAFHITDVAENSLRAGADKVYVELRLDATCFCFAVSDNGCGMDAPTLHRIPDPFYTTRTTRRVGLGLPFLFQNASRCKGSVSVHSELGAGTRVEATFPLNHIDCPPVGDLATTLMEIMTGTPGVEISILILCGESTFQFSTAELFGVLGGIPAGHPKAASAVREFIGSNIEEVFGGRLV